MSLLIGSARVAIVPDVQNFGADLRAKLAAELKSLGRLDVPVNLSLDQASMAQVRAQASSIPPASIDVKADLDKGSLAAVRAEADEYLSDAFNISTVDLKKANVNISALDAAAAHLNDTFGIFSDQMVPRFLASSRQLDAMNARMADSFGNIRSQAAYAALTDDQLAAAQRGLTDTFGESNAGERIAAELAADAVTHDQQRIDTLGLLADSLAVVTRAERTLAAASGGNGGNSGGGGILAALMGYNLFSGGGFFRTSIAGINVWHLALDGAIEALISIGTAAAAAAVGIAVLYPALDSIHDHLTGVYDVNTALGDQIPGLDVQFAHLAHSMAPQALELYGAGLNLITGQTGTLGGAAQKVVGIFDDWAAKIDLWSHGQGTFGALLQTGTGYLVQFGHVFGEIGIALGNLLRDDPGIARFLLDIISGGAKVLDLFTSLPQPIVYTTLALHGLYLWGKLLGGVLIKAAQGAVNMGKALYSIGTNPLAWVAAAVIALGYLAVEGGHAASSVQTLISNINSGLAKDSASQAILSITTDLGGLNLALDRLNSSSGFSLFKNQGDIQQAGYIVRAALDNIGSAASDLVHGNVLGYLSNEWKAFSGVFLFNSGPASALAMANSLKAINTEINSLLGSERNLFAETGHLMTQGFTYGQSLALMDLAGVKASDSFALMRQKVDNLITGYQAMSIRGSLLANSVNAITFSTDQQDSKVQQLTSAWSQFFSTLTGGESGFTSFMQALGGDLTTRISGATNSATVNTYQGLAQALATAKGNMTGLGAASISARAQFIQTASSAQSELNDLTMLASAAGLGARGTQMLTQASKDMVASMLPAAKQSTALTAVLYGLAQQGGYHGADSFKALSQWADNTKNPLKNLDGIVTKFTVDAGNLAQDVKNLSTALGTTLTGAMSQAIFYADGGQQAFNAYATALEHGSITSAATRSSAITLATELVNVTGNTTVAHREFDAMTTAMGYSKQQADKLWKSIQSVVKQEDNLHNKSFTISANLSASPAAMKLINEGVNPGGELRVGSYAAGTTSAAAGWAVVGEEGPELIRMRGGEEVMPTNSLGALAGALAGSGGSRPAALGGGGGDGMTVNQSFNGYGTQQLLTAVAVGTRSAAVAQGKQLRIGRRG